MNLAEFAPSLIGEPIGEVFDKVREMSTLSVTARPNQSNVDVVYPGGTAKMAGGLWAGYTKFTAQKLGIMGEPVISLIQASSGNTTSFQGSLLVIPNQNGTLGMVNLSKVDMEAHVAPHFGPLHSEKNYQPNDTSWVPVADDLVRLQIKGLADSREEVRAQVIGCLSGNQDLYQGLAGLTSGIRGIHGSRDILVRTAQVLRELSRITGTPISPNTSKYLYNPASLALYQPSLSVMTVPDRIFKAMFQTCNWGAPPMPLWASNFGWVLHNEWTAPCLGSNCPSVISSSCTPPLAKVLAGMSMGTVMHTPCPSSLFPVKVPDWFMAQFEELCVEWELMRNRSLDPTASSGLKADLTRSRPWLAITGTDEGFTGGKVRVNWEALLGGTQTAENPAINWEVQSKLDDGFLWPRPVPTPTPAQPEPTVANPAPVGPALPDVGGTPEGNEGGVPVTLIEFTVPMRVDAVAPNREFEPTPPQGTQFTWWSINQNLWPGITLASYPQVVGHPHADSTPVNRAEVVGIRGLSYEGRSLVVEGDPEVGLTVHEAQNLWDCMAWMIREEVQDYHDYNTHIGLPALVERIAATADTDLDLCSITLPEPIPTGRIESVSFRISDRTGMLASIRSYLLHGSDDFNTCPGCEEWVYMDNTAACENCEASYCPSCYDDHSGGQECENCGDHQTCIDVNECDDCGAHWCLNCRENDTCHRTCENCWGMVEEEGQGLCETCHAEEEAEQERERERERADEQAVQATLEGTQ